MNDSRADFFTCALPDSVNPSARLDGEGAKRAVITPRLSQGRRPLLRMAAQGVTAKVALLAFPLAGRAGAPESVSQVCVGLEGSVLSCLDLPSSSGLRRCASGPSPDSLLACFFACSPHPHVGWSAVLPAVDHRWRLTLCYASLPRAHNPILVHRLRVDWCHLWRRRSANARSFRPGPSKARQSRPPQES